MISVALCTYNGERYIKEQLDSIFSQSISVDEVVICDDCSTDSTCTILDEYVLRYSQIRLIKNGKNIGFRKNFEKALVECRGDYIFFSDQDDIWAKDKVAITVDYLHKTGMYGVFSNGKLIDGKGKDLNHTLFSIQQLAPYLKNGLLDKYTFEILCLKGNFVTGAALAITKAAKDFVLPFRTSKYVLHDNWIALKLSAQHKLGYIEKPLIFYRIHPRQECGLNLLDSKKRDFLLDSFVGKGDCKKLLLFRRGTAVIIFYCKFGSSEKKMLNRTYRNLYSNNLKTSSNKIKHKVLYYINELYVRTNSRFGFRV